MFKRAVFAGTALACWATAMPALAQNPPPRQEPPREERRDDRQEFALARQTHHCLVFLPHPARGDAGKIYP